MSSRLQNEWTVERVLSLAPDAASTKSGRDLAAPRKWQGVGRTDVALWGECQGSGSKPYRTQIDLTEPAFKCSCPSRKFPCKHALGLFLLLADHADAIPETAPPGWVQEWLESRATRAEKKAARAEDPTARPPAQPDPAARDRRAADREKKVAAGLDQLDRWLTDLMSRGLASAQAEGIAPWERIAAQMVDAQAPGLARLLRETADAVHSGEGWQDRVMLRLGRLYLLLEGYRRLPTLPPALQAEIRTRIGWTQATEEVLAAPPHRDLWSVVGQRVTLEDRLRVQRTWFWGRHQRKPALMLQFAPGAQPFATPLMPGVEFDADLCFYEAAHPLRALLKERRGAAAPVSRLEGHATIADATAAFAAALAASPWLELFPMPLSAVAVDRVDDDTFVLRDAEGAILPLSPRSPAGWQLLAQSGGHPLGVFGEWDGETLMPLAVTADGEFTPLGSEPDECS